MKIKQKCYNCKKEIRIPDQQKCDICGRISCENCIMKSQEYSGYLGESVWEKLQVNQVCLDCWDEKIMEFHDRYLRSMHRVNRTKCYKGDLPQDVLKNIQSKTYYETKFIDNKGLAEEKIRMSAFIDGYDFIYDLKFDKKENPNATDEDDAYLWKGSAMAGRIYKV